MQRRRLDITVTALVWGNRDDVEKVKRNTESKVRKLILFRSTSHDQKMGCGKSKDEAATGNTIAKTKRQKSKHDRSSSQRREGENKGANPEEVQNREAETKHEIVANADSRESRDEKKIEPSGQEWINGTSSGDGMTVEAVISDGISGRTEYYSPNNKDGGNGERVKNRVEEKITMEGSDIVIFTIELSSLVTHFSDEGHKREGVLNSHEARLILTGGALCGASLAMGATAVNCHHSAVEILGLFEKHGAEVFAHEVATGNTIAKTKRQKSKHDRSSFHRREGENKGANPEAVQNREAKTKHEIVANADSREPGDEKKIEPNEQEWINGTSSGDGVTVGAIISNGISGRTEYYSTNSKDGGNGERVKNRVEEKVSIEYEIREIKNVCN
ncbi:hypothetical protein RHSIM_Rhsim02G0012800 [Rhododendron simsii]|uniref:Uncharacterized protein n=1 Tax=Rhododendron simsii TaxID=118357 RepID=A0A834LUD6_RHOSS|nr:hypothetical protein RHSIM_Rhsim02G0012800 [Rhododendron simsii]